MKKIKIFHGGKPDELTKRVNDFISDNEEYMTNVELKYLQSSASHGDKASTWITVIVEYERVSD